MSRTPANASLQVVRGATWEDEFTYVDAASVAVNLTGYSARMQVRTKDGQYGLTTTTSLLLELTTANGLLIIDIPPGQTVPCRIKVRVPVASVALLNPNNERRVRLAYALEVFDPAQVPEYVVPLAVGNIIVTGETTR